MQILSPAMMTATPEMLMLGLLCVVILSELFLKSFFRASSYFVSQLGLIGIASYLMSHLMDAKQFGLSQLMVADKLSHLLQLMVVLGAFVIAIYSRSYVRETKIPAGDMTVLSLFSVLGMMVMAASNSMLTVYLGLELLSLPLYAMVGLQKENARASEAAMKYFIMGAIASGMMLYGMSMIYGATGHLVLTDIGRVVAGLPLPQWLLLQFGLVCIVVGIGFKFASAPFHMWAPDVYEGAPMSVTLFLSSLPKLAALGMALRLLVVGMPQLAVYWQQMLIVMAVLSITIGNLFALVQSNIKRLFAYSAIAHMGYMLLGFLTANAQGYSAALFYTIVYALTSVGAFGLLVLLSHAGFEAENLEDFEGLNNAAPGLAVLFLIVLFSLAGMPPFIGFFAKLFVIKALLGQQMLGLAIFAMIFAIVGAYYYIRVIRLMYFSDKIFEPAPVIALDGRMMLALNALALLGLGMFPQGLFNWCLKAIG